MIGFTARIKRLAKIGVSESLRPDQKKSILFINYVCLFLVFSTLIEVIIFCFIGQWDSIFYNVPTLLMLLPSFYFNSKGYYKASKMYLVNQLNFSIMTFAFLTLREYGLDYLLFPNILLSLSIFNYDEKRELFINIFISISCLLLIHLLDFNIGIKMDADPKDWNQTSSIILTSIYTLGIMFYLIHNNHSNIKDLLALKDHSMKMAHLSTLGTVAASITHEIKNPLTVIKMKTSTILRSLDQLELLPPKIGNDLDAITKNVDRISKIISSFKTISRKTDADPMTPVNLASVIEESHTLVAEKAHLKGVQIEIPTLPDMNIMGRASELGQVFIIFFSNAIEAVENLEERWVKLDFIDQNENFTLRIVDSGSGIPLTVQEKMFQPFYTTKPAGQGTGLGLSIALKILDDHDISLQVDNSAPQTTFLLSIRKQNLNLSEARTAAFKSRAS